MRDHLLEARTISKSYSRAKKVVDNISLSLGSGEILGLLGPNGAGKTTCFYMIVGLARADSGSILLNGKDITKVPLHKRSSLGMSYLPQRESIYRGLSVKDNLWANLEMTGLSKQEKKDSFDSVVEMFGLGGILTSKGASLSGGERRRVEIGRAVLSKPQFLLLDEPFAGVDPVTVQSIQILIKNLASKGMGVLITDHNVRETLELCSRAVVMASGKEIASGEPDAVLASDLVKELYLGSEFSI